MAKQCDSTIAQGEIDLTSQLIRWSTETSNFSSTREKLEARLLYTADRVCAHLKFYRFDQIVWQDEQPMTASVLVEAIDLHRARFEIGCPQVFEPQSVFGSVPIAAFEQSDQVFLLSDANPSLSPGPQVVYVNQAFEKMTGYKKREIIGKTPRILQGEGTDPGARDRIRTALGSWNPIQIELLNYRKDNTPFIVHLDITPITDSIGWYIFWFAIQRDVTTEQRRLNDMISMAKAAGIAEGATNALHNIGNVLNSILLTTHQLDKRMDFSFIQSLKKLDHLLQSQADNLQGFYRDDPRSEKIPGLISAITESAISQIADVHCELKEIANNADHISAVISGQRENSKSGNQLEPVSIDSLVDQSLAACKVHFQKHSIDVDKDIESNLPLIPTDRHQVIQILANLLKNACEAVSEANISNPKINVNVKKHRDSLRVEVIDNGIGIDTEKMSHIFERGFTTKSSGCGFGLHSCVAIAEELGGSLSASSDGALQGSTFAFTLPTAAELMTSN